MGGRGSFDKDTQSIPLENREYTEIGRIGDIKVIEGISTLNGKTPVMSNSASSIYGVYSQKAGRIKHIFYYENHILVKAIDIDGANSHWHQVSYNPETGQIGRLSHDPGNRFDPDSAMWNLINAVSRWRKN